MTTINGQPVMERRQPNPLTSGQQLEQIRRIVKWTLWKQATAEDSVDEDGNLSPLAQAAQQQFQDPAWVAGVVGSFAANQATRSVDQDIDYLAFLGLDQAQERRQQ